MLVYGCSQGPQDEAIARAVKSSLIDYEPVNLQRVEVSVGQGTVYLSGEVENKEERSEAGKLAGRAPGVKNVINKLQVVP